MQKTVEITDKASERSQLSAASVSFWGSIALFVISAAAGIAVDSITLILDASASLVILVVAFLMSSTIKKIHSPPDEIFNFGYEKYEPFTVVLQGALIITTCLISAKFAIQDIVHSEDIENYRIPVIAACLSVAIGVFVSIFIKAAARRTHSSMMHTASMHWFIDTGMSVGILGGFCAGWVLKEKGYTNITRFVDPAMAIILALIFIIPPARTIKRHFMELLDAVPSKDIRDKVRQVVDEYKPRMFGVSRVRTRKAGDKIFVDICFVVKEDMTVREAEAVAADFEKDLKTHLRHLDVVVYFKPMK
ncbi:MAG: cation diffusion facilitator family transporter [Candidatus Omnitrophota bacterium]|jgi:cation diffusion facilitator family transporter